MEGRALNHLWKRAARRTEHVSGDILPQLVTGKGLGVMRTEHKANSSTTVSSECQGTASAHGPLLRAIAAT